MITLATCIYEKNFRNVLSDESWFISYNHNLISKKVIVVNNITDSSFFDFEKLKQKYNNINFILHSEHVTNVNKVFSLNTDMSDISFYYSIQHYVTILTEKSNDFIFFVGADCNIFSNDLTDFFENSIKLLTDDIDIITTTIPWSKKEEFADSGEQEQTIYDIKKRHKDFYMSKVFSDQVWFANTNRIKNVDFTNIEDLHPYPIYGGNTFEKRLGNFLIKNNKYRAIFKTTDYYHHKSF